jgi:hypothetical protein
MRDFYDLNQGKHRSKHGYYDEFNSMVLTATKSGATIGLHPGARNEVLNTTAANTTNPTATATEHGDATKIATSRYLAVAFLLGADKIRHGTLVEEIENEYLRNKGNSSTTRTYPTSIAESCDYLCNYKRNPKNLTRLLGPSEKDSTCISPFVHPNVHVITCSSFMWPEMHASTEEFIWFLYVRTPLVIASHSLFPRAQKDALTTFLIHAN